MGPPAASGAHAFWPRQAGGLHAFMEGPVARSRLRRTAAPRRSLQPPAPLPPASLFCILSIYPEPPVFQEVDVRPSACLAAAKSLQSCPTPCDPIDGSPPGSPSLGLSRQEHWSGLPFPSPMHESEKWKGSRSVVSDSSRHHGLQPTRTLRPPGFPGKRTGVGCHHLLHLLGCLVNKPSHCYKPRCLRVLSFWASGKRTSREPCSCFHLFFQLFGSFLCFCNGFLCVSSLWKEICYVQRCILEPIPVPDANCPRMHRCLRR